MNPRLPARHDRVRGVKVGTDMHRPFSVLTALALALALFPLPSVAADEPGQGTVASSPGQDTIIQNTPGGVVQVRMYTHPEKKYSVPLPPGAELLTRKDNSDVAVRSPRGWVAKIQTGDANPSIPLANMAARLEEAYLGTGKPWTTKLGDRMIDVGGLQAYDGIYEGSNSRSRVVIARGAANDYVFLFFAPEGGYEELGREFEWMLTNFKPAAPDLFVDPGPRPPVKGPAAGSAGAGAIGGAQAALQPAAPKPLKPAEPPPPPVSFESRAARFKAPGYGFVIDYPHDWLIERSSPHRVVFSGQPGTDAYVAMVTVENVAPPGAADGTAAMATALADIRKGLEAGASEVRYVGEGTFVYSRDGVQVEGHKVLAAYTHDNERFRKWLMIVPRPGAPVAHVWHYTAPESRFERYRTLAESMLKSWGLDLSAPVAAR